jgi:hypothetical protein
MRTQIIFGMLLMLLMTGQNNYQYLYVKGKANR